MISTLALDLSDSILLSERPLFEDPTIDEKEVTYFWEGLYELFYLILLLL